MPTPLTIYTPELLLRPLAVWDAPFLFGMVSHAEVRRYLGGPAPMIRRPGQVAGYLRADDDAFVWMVLEKPDLRRVGMVFLSPHKDGADMELSYQFARVSWGRGLATLACAQVLEHARAKLGLARVIAETQAANVASCRLLQRLGMREYQRVMRFGAEQVLYST